jgi:transposase
MQQEFVTVGVDLAKNVFQVHAIDADDKVLVRRQPRRAEVLKFFAALPPCLVGMEACASAHHWGRELLALGHDVQLMPSAYVKPYVKRGKTDAADAEAICEAVTRAIRCCAADAIGGGCDLRRPDQSGRITMPSKGQMT